MCVCVRELSVSSVNPPDSLDFVVQNRNPQLECDDRKEVCSLTEMTATTPTHKGRGEGRNKGVTKLVEAANTISF